MAAAYPLVNMANVPGRDPSDSGDVPLLINPGADAVVDCEAEQPAEGRKAKSRRPPEPEVDIGTLRAHELEALMDQGRSGAGGFPCPLRPPCRPPLTVRTEAEIASILAGYFGGASNASIVAFGGFGVGCLLLGIVLLVLVPMSAVGGAVTAMALATMGLAAMARAFLVSRGQLMNAQRMQLLLFSAIAVFAGGCVPGVIIPALLRAWWGEGAADASTDKLGFVLPWAASGAVSLLVVWSLVSRSKSGFQRAILLLQLLLVVALISSAIIILLPPYYPGAANSFSGGNDAVREVFPWVVLVASTLPALVAIYFLLAQRLGIVAANRLVADDQARYNRRWEVVKSQRENSFEFGGFLHVLHTIVQRDRSEVKGQPGLTVQLDVDAMPLHEVEQKLQDLGRVPPPAKRTPGLLGLLERLFVDSDSSTNAREDLAAALVERRTARAVESHVAAPAPALSRHGGVRRRGGRHGALAVLEGVAPASDSSASAELLRSAVAKAMCGMPAGTSVDALAAKQEGDSGVELLAFLHGCGLEGHCLRILEECGPTRPEDLGNLPAAALYSRVGLSILEQSQLAAALEARRRERYTPRQLVSLSAKVGALLAHVSRTSDNSGYLRPRQALRDLSVLFGQAATLNAHFQKEVVGWCEGMGPHSIVHDSPIKRRRRAIEKVFRSYNGDAGWLIDIVRAGITFQTVEALVSCLERIDSDPRVVILQIKNRLHPEASSTAGYRNVALNLVIVDEYTMRFAVDAHVCELQLGLKTFNDLKNDAGHARYVKWRDRLAE